MRELRARLDQVACKLVPRSTQRTRLGQLSMALVIGLQSFDANDGKPRRGLIATRATASLILLGLRVILTGCMEGIMLRRL